jgi:DNA-binding PadR family transcriptional regulator
VKPWHRGISHDWNYTRHTFYNEAENKMKSDDRQLLLLGLLRIQEMHGYQLNQFLEEHLDFIANLKPATAYYTLEKMAERGLVEVHLEQAGNRPPRQIYTITAQGEQHFQELLRRNLARYDMQESADDIGIAFLADLPMDEARRLLAQKREMIEAKLAKIQDAASRVSVSDATHLSLLRAESHLQSDLAWLKQVEAWLVAQNQQVN